MPSYDAVLDADLDWGVVVPGMRLVPVVWQMAQVLEDQITDASGELVPIYAIDCPALYHRTGGLDLQSDGSDWPDNDARFALLRAVAAYLASPHGPLDWQPNIVQLNDWQSSLAAAYCQFSNAADTQVITTVHNLSFAGDYPQSQVSQWGLPKTAHDINGLNYYGRASLFKAGLFCGDHITTVSPTYAREIQSAPLGCGIEGLLASRARQLTGTLNGIGTAAWDPASDAALPANYDTRDLTGKAVNKAALQCTFALDPHVRVPLFGMVTRRTWQKGVDTVLSLAAGWLSRGEQIVILGTGEPGIESSLTELASAHPHTMGFKHGYDESLAHLIEGGADAFLMPSLFEPYGLNHMYSMRYGTPPIVRATGRLADTVRHASASAIRDGTATSFIVGLDSSGALDAAVTEAMTLYADTESWTKTIRTAMHRGFSWGRSALQYAQLYQQLFTPNADASPPSSPAHNSVRGAAIQ